MPDFFLKMLTYPPVRFLAVVLLEFLAFNSTSAFASDSLYRFEQQIFIAEIEHNKAALSAAREICLAVASRETIKVGLPFDEKYLGDPPKEVIEGVRPKFPKLTIMAHSECEQRSTKGGREKQWIVAIGFFEASWSFYRLMPPDNDSMHHRIAIVFPLGRHNSFFPSVILYKGDADSGNILHRQMLSSSQT